MQLFVSSTLRCVGAYLLYSESFSSPPVWCWLHSAADLVEARHCSRSSRCVACPNVHRLWQCAWYCPNHQGAEVDAGVKVGNRCGSLLTPQCYREGIRLRYMFLPKKKGSAVIVLRTTTFTSCLRVQTFQPSAKSEKTAWYTQNHPGS